MDHGLPDVRAFRRALRSLERQVELSLAAETECCGITPAQCHVLLAAEEGGESSLGDLALALELDLSTLSRTADRLVKAGLLLRREDPANRRRQLVSLSPAGVAKATEINGLCDGYYAGFLATLPAQEVRSMGRLLPRFARALGEWRRARNPGGCCGQALPAPEEGA